MCYTLPPAFMQQGSNGPVVNTVINFLIGWATKYNRGPTGLEADGYFGERCSEWLKKFQDSHQIEPDGHCGPATRAVMLRAGFHFDTAACTGRQDITEFIQSDGSSLFWAPYAEARNDEQSVREQLDVLQHDDGA